MERGDIILDGLLRTIGGLLVIALLTFEIGAVVVNHVQLDRASQSLARTAASAWESGQGRSGVDSTVEEAATDYDGVVVHDVHADGERVAVTVSRPAPVLVADRIGPLAPHLVANTTAATPASR